MGKRKEDYDKDYDIRIATVADAFEISLLYHEVYGGTYPDPLMRDISKLSGFISSGRALWVVIERKGKILGSAVYEVNARHKIAKLFGAVVLPEERGKGLLEKAMECGDDYLVKDLKIVEVIYATTRTATPAAQKVVRKMGYKNLGLFPNVRKTENYETHCLSAKFAKNVLENKFSNFKLHPKIKGIYDIVRKDCRLPDLEVAQPSEYANLKKDKDIPTLEIIDAAEFVARRFKVIKDKQFLYNLYPFQKPNLLITSPCQRIEVFAYLSQVDKYSTIIGLKDTGEFCLSQILKKVSRLLHNAHSRYIEITAQASRLHCIEQILEADFIPCAYFPAYQLGDKYRYDFVFFSKTFEVLNFKNLRFEGLNKDYLMAYYENWRQRALDTAM